MTRRIRYLFAGTLHTDSLNKKGINMKKTLIPAKVSCRKFPGVTTIDAAWFYLSGLSNKWRAAGHEPRQGGCQNPNSQEG